MSPTESPASNVLELTVGELSGELKRTIEDRFGFVRVRGEISNYRGPHSSGHAYFCLKDETARIDAVVWKSAFSRLKTKPQEGLEVIATGRVTTFPGKSAYQIIIEAIEPAGVGALMAVLEARRQALAVEGLFDEVRKKRLPFLPTTIGVVTSPTGAVIRDILHRIEDRFPRNVLVWPVRVQGETTAAEVAAAIQGFDALPPAGTIPRPDVIIVARGGGSLEDLWGFNEEAVVRAAAACTIPLISAVGHETDWTLLDHAADLRAPTPSGAAEKAVPVRADLIAQTADLTARHTAGVLRFLERRHSDVRGLSRALPSGDAIVGVPRQRLDRAQTRLGTVVARARDQRQLALARLAHRLSQQAPRTRLAQTQHRLDALEQRLGFVVARAAERHANGMMQQRRRLAIVGAGLRRDLHRTRDSTLRLGTDLDRGWHDSIRRRQGELDRLDRLLRSLGYRQVLNRGFALVRDKTGHPLRSTQGAAEAVALDIEFQDGHIEAVTGALRAPRVTKPTDKAKIKQGSLF